LVGPGGTSPTLCGEVEGLAPSWRSGDGVGLIAGMNGAVAGFSGSSAEERGHEGRCKGISVDEGVGATGGFVVWKPLTPLVAVDELVVWANVDATADCTDVGAVMAVVGNGLSGVKASFKGSVFGAKVAPVVVFANTECVPDAAVKVLGWDVIPEGDTEANELEVGVDDDAVAAGVLAKTDFKGSGLGTPNTDVLLNAFGVVARLEKADRTGCEEVNCADVELNGLEGADRVDCSPKNGDFVAFCPKLFVDHSEALG
jgi:hypothetical protein